MNLSDINGLPQKPTLQAFNPVVNAASILNAATVNNVATHAASMSPPDQMERNYSLVSTELTGGTDGSPTLNSVLDQNKTADQGAMYAELNRVLSDPAISADDKAKYMDGYINASTSDGTGQSLTRMVSEKALAEDTGPDETDETVETALFDLHDTLNQSDIQRTGMQDLINFKLGVKDRNWLDWGVDFLEDIIPFMDQAATTKTLWENGDGAGALKSLILPGDGKAKIRDAISRMPFDKRIKAAEALIEMVKNNKGSITPRTNVLNQMNQLNAMLVSGNYKDGDQLLDNIFATLDVVFPFAEKLLAPTKAASAAADVKRALNAEQDMVKIADSVEQVATDIVAKAPDPVTFNADETTLAGIRDIVHSKIYAVIRPGATKPGAFLPKGQSIDDLHGALEKVDKLLVGNNLSNPKKLGQDVAAIVRAAIGKTKMPDTDVNKLIKYIHEESKVNRVMARAVEDHNSMAATFRASNPKKARILNNMVEADPTDKTAKIMTGTTRQEAIVTERAPEVGNIDKSVRNKVEMDEAMPAPDKGTVESIKANRGRSDLSSQEKAGARKGAIDAFTNVTGLTPRRAMATVDENTYVETPTGASFNMVYGPKDGGFSNATQGLYQVLVGLKKYGVTEKEVEILARQADGNYHVVTGLPTEKGNYLIRVKHDYEFAPGDVIEKSLLESDKGYRMFESRHNLTHGGAGGILQHLIPSSAIIDKVLFNSASVASDATARIQKRLVKLAADYAKDYKALSTKQKELVDLYRIEANNKGIPFSSVNLKARGFDDAAIETMRKWKTTTDTMWWLENVDVNKSLRSLGWNRFVDNANDIDLVAKPVVNRGLDGARVYDPTTNMIRSVDAKELTDLYKKNGTLAELKHPLTIGDDDATYLLVKEGQSGYLRRLRDDDVTMPYRDGYYPIKYDAPIFIRKKYRTKDGREYLKAIAVSGNHADATALVNRMRAADSKGEYIMTGDLKRGTQDFKDAEWDVVVSTGRSAQRVRGQRLVDASAPTDLNHVHVESPEESLVNSIKSIASRTAFRDWVESSKSRWLENYGGLIDSTNPNQWPTSIKQIGSNNLEISNTLLKDAKANWRFINAMESGYVNILDDASKNFFANFADTASRRGWGWLEGPARALSRGSPSGYMRKKAFRLLLAANPLRQLPIQAMQALPVILATNPLAIPKIASQMILLDFLAKGGDAATFMKGVAKAATGMDEKSAKALAEHWDASGFEAAVEAHTLIRDEIGSLVDRTMFAKAKSLAAKPLDALQKIGFNLGERLLMRSVWLSEYDLLVKTGKKIDAEVLDGLNARVRNLTLNMNRAGEMPYNENVFSAAMQFFQAPHKAFAQILLGHKGLSGTDRLKLGASYITTYGIGAGPITSMIMSNFKGDPEMRDAIEGGVFNMAMNTALRNVFQDETNIDFADSLRLVPQPDVFKFWDGLMRTDIPELLSSSPSASLILGNSPRVTTFVKSLLRPFTVDDSQRPEAMMLIGKNFADMFSGASNFFKAKYALEHEKLMSGKGVVNDWDVTPVEAVGKLMGFATRDEITYYAAQEATYKATEAYKGDIKLVIDEVSARLADQSISADQEDWYFTMMAEGQRVFGNQPLYMEEFANQIKYKAAAGEYDLYSRLRKLAGSMDDNEFEALADRSGLPDEMVQTLKQLQKFGKGN